MGERSSIEWTDATWNPITGCTPVSDGCTNCYAARMIGRGLPKMGHEGPFSRVQFHPSRLDQPLRWKKSRRIFVCSMGDLFHRDVDYKWIDSVFRTIKSCQQHTFLILTKRPEEMRLYMHADQTDDPIAAGGWPPPNLWLGVTAENQEMADQRIPILLQTPAAKRFMSIEPCLGPVDLRAIWTHCPEHDYSGGFCVGPCPSRRKIDWVICGGETGAGARFLHPHWIENLRDQCTEAGVPFFFKGWGTKMMKKSDPNYMKIDGREWKEFPR